MHPAWNANGLTDRQEKILAFVRERVNSGLPPTLREIGKRFDISSMNGVVCHLNALEKKGMIVRGRLSREITVAGDVHKKLAAAESLVKEFVYAAKATLSVLAGEVKDDVEPGAPLGACENMLAELVRKAEVTRVSAQVEAGKESPHGQDVLRG